jgi:hypothetical protein
MVRLATFRSVRDPDLPFKTGSRASCVRGVFIGSETVVGVGEWINSWSHSLESNPRLQGLDHLRKETAHSYEERCIEDNGVFQAFAAFMKRLLNSASST